MVQNYKTYYTPTYQLKLDTLHYTCIWCWKEFDSGFYLKKYAEESMLNHYDICPYFSYPSYKNSTGQYLNG